MLSGKDDGDDVVKRVSRDDGRSDNNNNERDSSEDVIRILFRELAETALEEKPRGDTLVSNLSKCLCCPMVNNHLHFSQAPPPSSACCMHGC